MLLLILSLVLIFSLIVLDLLITLAFSFSKELFLFLTELNNDLGNINLCNSGLISLFGDFSILFEIFLYYLKNYLS